jgi:beta propeller repeat protein
VTRSETSRSRAPSASAWWLVIPLLTTLAAYPGVPIQATGADTVPGLSEMSETPPSPRPSRVPHPEGTASRPGQPACLPGQIIVKFKPSLMECAHCLLAHNRTFASALADGSGSLDELNRKNRVRRARSVFVDRDNTTTDSARASQELSRQDIARRFGRRSARAPADSARPDLTNIYVLDVPREADVAAISRAYAADPHVEYAQPDYLIRASFTPNDPYFQSSNSWGQGYDDLWALKKIHAPEAWDVTQGEGVTVAVVDTGVDYTHPDIAANVVPGWNFVTDTSDPLDDNGHGTHVAGTIAAIGNNNLGIVGVAPQAKILPVKALDSTGSGGSVGAAAGIVYAAQHGADVINNSWGCPNPGCASNPLIEDAVRAVYGLGVVTVFAAGNDRLNVANYSPLNMLEAKPIVVAASNDADGAAFFSNYGITVDVAAPGSGRSLDLAGAANILSLRSSSCAPSLCDAALLVGDRYLRLPGTSMAAPHASGAAALVLSRHPGLSNEEVRQALRVSADDIDARGFDRYTGEGRINVARAVGVDAVVQAAITEPSVLAFRDRTLTEAVEIRGTAAGPGFKQYQLFYALPTQPDDWVPLAPPVASSVMNGALGSFAIADRLPVGLYHLKLVCESASGSRTEAFSQFALEHGLRRLSQPPAFEIHPDISGQRIVWTHTYNDPTERLSDTGWHLFDGDIFLYDLTRGTQRQITDSGLAACPAISGDRIVWLDFRRSFDGDIYMYDLRTNLERPIATDPGPRRSDPAISGDRIIWLQNDDIAHDAPYSVQLYDLATNTTRQVTAASAQPVRADIYGNAAISGDWVAWVDVRNGLPGGEVFVYDLAAGTERQLTSRSASLVSPPVGLSGDRAVWIGYNARVGWDIVAYDLKTNAMRSVSIPTSTEGSVQAPFWPRSSGDRLLWTDFREDVYLGNVFSYDLKTNTEQQITSQALNQGNAVISGNTAVWMDDREGSHIYLYEFAPSARRPSPRPVPFH